MLIGLNTLLRRHRRRVTIAAAVVVVAGAVALAHGVMAGDHMGGGMVMCLAVVETAAFVVLRATGAAGSAVRRSALALPLPASPDLEPPRPPVPRLVRAGAAEVQVFRL